VKKPSKLLTTMAAFLYAFIYAPIIVVIVFSFNASRHGASWSGFTLEWYRSLLNNTQALSAARNTLVLALCSTAVATVLGTLLGFALRRYAFRGQQALNQLLHIPVFIPDIVMAVSLLMFFAWIRQRFGLFQLGLPTMIVAHVTFQIPFVAVIVRSRMAGLDPVLEEAAHDLGATAWQAFWKVTFPLLLPGVLAASMLAFTLSLDDFVVSFFTSGPGSTTLPILIYASVKRGVTPDINALSSLLIATSVIGATGVLLLQRGRKVI
jgi:spermidine/putrescine transport system permease protein